MSEQTVLLSVKEIGYFASRLLAAAHCLPGAAPELARVVVAHDLLHGGALEELIQLVANDRYLLNELTIDVEQMDKQGAVFKFTSSHKPNPAFAVGPWVLDRIIAEGQRHGAASAVLTLEPRDHSWLDSLLVTRSAPGLALIAVSGSNPHAISLVVQGQLYHEVFSNSTTGDDSEHSARIPAILRRYMGSLDELAVNEVGAWAVEADPGLIDWTANLEPQVSLNQRRRELYRSGRRMAQEPWQLLRSIVSQTFIPTSSKSRMGAD